MISFLTTYKIGFLTIHLLAMAVGLGGATVSDILFFKFLKDYRISKKELEVLDVLKGIILTAMCLIIISGICLYIPRMQELNASPMFVVKAFATMVLFINGIALHAFIAPHLLHLNLKNQEVEWRRWRHVAFALGGISISSWYSVFLIAMLKGVLQWSLYTSLSTYLGVLAVAVTGSQIMEAHLQKVAIQSSSKK